MAHDFLLAGASRRAVCCQVPSLESLGVAPVVGTFGRRSPGATAPRGRIADDPRASLVADFVEQDGDREPELRLPQAGTLSSPSSSMDVLDWMHEQVAAGNRQPELRGEK